MIIHDILIIVIAAAVTFAIRAVPFIIFDRGETTPGWLNYLGKVLPAALMSFLLIYCIRGCDFAGRTHGLIEIGCIAVTMALHFWKRNTFLSIGVGTVLYMILIRVI